MSYSTIETIVITYEPTASAAEIHGVATGLLCLNRHAEGIIWLHEVFQDAALLEEDKAVLLALFDQTQALLKSTDFSYDLFIPDDDFTLDEQVTGISNWCQGFLFGVGFANSSKEWPGESREIIKDMVEISKITLEDDDAENENALMEIHEYLRVAVMSLCEEFDDSNDREHQQIH